MLVIGPMAGLWVCYTSTSGFQATLPAQTHQIPWRGIHIELRPLCIFKWQRNLYYVLLIAVFCFVDSVCHHAAATGTLDFLPLTEIYYVETCRYTSCYGIAKEPNKIITLY